MIPWSFGYFKKIIWLQKKHSNGFSLQNPIVIEKLHTFSTYRFLCIYETGPVIINAKIPISGYTSGQTVELRLDIKNLSNKTLRGFRARIVKVSCLLHVTITESLFWCKEISLLLKPFWRLF